MQRQPEFSFPGSLARGAAERAPALPPRPRVNPMAPRPGEEEIRWLQASRQGSPDYGSGGSGTPSPQLWAHHGHEDHRHRLYPASAGSSPSRVQAIAGYRREMLDLVRGLPECAYELSLRDIVERPSPSSSPPSPPPPPSSTTDAAVRDHEPADTKKDAAAGTTAGVDERQKQSSSKKQGRKQRTTRKQRSRSLERSVSLDTGLLIKLFMPLSIGGGKKKVSPKPDAGKDSKKKEKEKKKKKKKQGKKKDAKEQDEEWWTKSEFSEAASSSRTSSTGSSNSSTGSVRNGHGNGSTNPRAPVRSRSRKRTGCYAFFRTNKSKNAVNQD